MKIGTKEISLNLPTDHTETQLKKKISKKLRIREFSYEIKKKSLDARKKGNIHWQIRVRVSSKEIAGGTPIVAAPLDIPYKKRSQKAVVVGSGPAGFFAALVLQKAGFNTILIERGSDAHKRSDKIREFEETGVFSSTGNYAFGEGGAGTFSDGKLTSRSKHISQEKEFVISSYIKAGAPEEIGYLAHPHLGSDNIKKIVCALREEFLSLGGKVFFETFLEDLKVENGIVREAITSGGLFQADKFIIASGHSAYETYRMLMARGVKFRTKNFAIGSRVEHPQEIINKAQWGALRLPGVKAAEYRLTSKGSGGFPVYTFCMCPGGTIVPSAAYENTNIVNGMSRYARDEKFANAGCVAGIDLNRLKGAEISPQEALDWLENIEKSFYEYSNGFGAPFCTIRDFIDKKETSKTVESSYPLSLKPAALWELLPLEVSDSILVGLKEFSKKIKGFEVGIIMGLESKTSSPIQVEREPGGLCCGFKNLYMVGEVSGSSGGIISSAADGIKAAMSIANHRV